MHAVCSIPDAIAALDRAWPQMIDECRAVLGSEQHYQAVVYYCLRNSGAVPRAQIGMNVKQWITLPISPLFQEWDNRKHEDYRGGFEPVPDAVIFRPEIQADWRRRNREETLRCMLLAIEIKASERAKGRLRSGEVVRDIRKLDAHRTEVRHRGGDMHPVMMIVDTAPTSAERMTGWAREESLKAASEHNVSLLYVSREEALAVWAIETGIHTGHAD